MVIAETKIPAKPGTVAGAIVLRKLDKGGGSYVYVTHFRRDDDGEYGNGNYFTVWNDIGPLRAAAIFAEAVKDYADRVAEYLYEQRRETTR